MKNTLSTNKIPMPPAFMATTRQKILLGEHFTPESEFAIIHQRAMSAINAVESFTKGIVNFAKKF